MNFKPNPLLYGATEDFYSSFKLAITMSAPVNYDALLKAVETAMPRYPYFCVSPERNENDIMVERYDRLAG